MFLEHLFLYLFVYPNVMSCYRKAHFPLLSKDLICTMAVSKCIFCRIIKGELPAYKLLETEKSLAFLDIQPLSRGHTLIIPKQHAEKLHELDDDFLTDILPLTKRLAGAMGLDHYNLLQVFRPFFLYFSVADSPKNNGSGIPGGFSCKNLLVSFKTRNNRKKGAFSSDSQAVRL